MKNITLYEITVPLFIKTLENIDAQLEKAIIFAEQRNADVNKLLHDRIVFDQFPLVKQIQICTDIAKRTTGYIAGIEIPKYEDTETTMPEIKNRIEKTLTYIRSVTPEQFEGKDNMLIPMSWMPTKGLYAAEGACIYTVPNFLFHATLAYEILRKNGVALGKMDYIGQLPLVDVA
ncbi:MAG: DUF1993 domain-containing protein [Minisyncoccia bacterium]